MESGTDMALVAENPELTTQRAASILGVSHPFLIQLLDDRKIPSHMVQSRRCIDRVDLLSYKAKRDRARHRAQELAVADVAAGVYDAVILPDGARDE